MIGFLTLPIRLLGIVLMVAFCIQAMAPLRSLELSLFDTAGGRSGGALVVATQSGEPSSLLSLGLGLVAIIAIWLIYQTWRQQITLAEREFRNRN